MSVHARLAAFWSLRYDPLRAYFFVQGIYALLAFDCWFEMIQHGGRYGIGGFNVAHFAWLDRVLPVPTPAFYVGLLIASGALALQCVLGRAPRALRLLLALLYTLSWMISMHDSYQHHYLLSWLLLWCAASPELSAEQAEKRTLITGWGLPMASLTCAIVYIFTGISKTEAVWRSGHVLRLLTKSHAPGDPSPGKFDAARDLLLATGLTDAGVWRLFALATIALQWAIAGGYLAAPGRDERVSRTRVVLTSVGLLAVFSFHGVAELFHVFEIGVFSYYMLWIGLVLLAPAQLLAQPARAISAGVALLRRLTAGPPSTFPRVSMAGGVIAALLLVALGFAIPLPGAPWALVLLSLVVSVRFALLAWGRSYGELEKLALSTVLSGSLIWLALTKTDIPFDYYRRTAGELSRMGQLEQALQMYRRAELHARRGKSRADKIRELETELARQRSP